MLGTHQKSIRSMNTQTALFIMENVERIKKERKQKLLEEIEKIEMEEYKETKMYKLDTSTIETIEDVKIILDGLELIISEESTSYEYVKKYFKEVE